MAAKIIPFNIPIVNSLITFEEKLFFVKLFKIMDYFYQIIKKIRKNTTI